MQQSPLRPVQTSDHLETGHAVLSTGDTLGPAPRADVDQGCVHVAHGAVTRVGVTTVRPQLAHQLAVHPLGAAHRGHGHPLGQGRGRRQVLEGPAVSPRVVVLVLTEAGGPGVVAGPGGAVLTRALVALAAHGLRVGVSRLVAAAHALPLAQPATNNP